MCIRDSSATRKARVDFKITGLPVTEFAHLFALDAAALQRKGIVRVVADEPHAFPCRITLEDADPGESLLLLTYAHQAARTPYAASGPIFVRCAAGATDEDRTGRCIR